MSKTLGEKIKELRKEMKLTQTELAGSEMTKSMLSQIENNQAVPSMKNLQYLAARLNKSVSYFLDDISHQENIKAEEIYNKLRNITKLINTNKSEEARIEIEKILHTYQLDPSSKLYADVQSKYGECLVDLKKFDEGEEIIRKAIEAYSGKYLYIDAAKSFLNLMGKPWSNFDYHQCLSLVSQALELYDSSINKDYAFEIEILYIQSVLYAGINDAEGTLAAINKALNISKETDIYYKSDELYKNLAAVNMLMDNHENFERYIEKARQYAVFTESKVNLSNIEGICALYFNKINEPQKALEKIQVSQQLNENIPSVLLAEKAKAYYFMEQYETAMEVISKIEYPAAYTPHRYDYLALLNGKIYEGLTLNKLGKTNEAVKAIKDGIEKMELLGESKALAFAYKSLSEVYSDLNDFENAFIYLKKSTTMEEVTKVKKIYF